MGQYQELHRKLNIHHAACAVFDVKQIGLHAVSGAQLVAHGHNFLAQ